MDVRASTPSPRAGKGSKPSGETVAGSKPTPRTIADDKEWRRSTFTSLFGRGNATRAAHVATVRERAGAGPETTDEWVVGAAIGVGRARDMALDRKHASHAWLPLAFAAAHVRRDGERVDPSAPPPAPAAARLAAIAARAVTEGRAPPRLAKPGSGVCVSGGFPADVDERGRRALSVDPVAAALARAPAIIAAHFATTRADGRAIAGFVDDAGANANANTNTNDADASSANTGGSSVAGSAAAVSAAIAGSAAATRREWNRALCACVVSAYATMVTHARLEMAPSLPAEAFYAMWPRSESLGLPPPPELDPEGRVADSQSGSTRSNRSVANRAGLSFAGAADAVSARNRTHPASELFVKPLYRELGRRRCSELGRERRVETLGRVFPPGWVRGGFVGRRRVARPLAAAFISRHFPVIARPRRFVRNSPRRAWEAPRANSPPRRCGNYSERNRPRRRVGTRRRCERTSNSSSAPRRTSSRRRRRREEETPRRRRRPRRRRIPDGCGGRDGGGGRPVNDWLAAAGLGGATATATASASASSASDDPPHRPSTSRRFAISRAFPCPPRAATSRGSGRGRVDGVGGDVGVGASRRVAIRALADVVVDDARAVTRAPEVPRGDVRAGIHARAVGGGTRGRFRRVCLRGYGRVAHGSRRGEDGTLAAEPSDAWLTAFWNEMARAPPEALEHFAAWPLVPVRGDELVRVGHRAAVFAPLRVRSIRRIPSARRRRVRRRRRMSTRRRRRRGVPSDFAASAHAGRGRDEPEPGRFRGRVRVRDGRPRCSYVFGVPRAAFDAAGRHRDGRGFDPRVARVGGDGAASGSPATFSSAADPPRSVGVGSRLFSSRRTRPCSTSPRAVRVRSGDARRPRGRGRVVCSNASDALAGKFERRARVWVPADFDRRRLRRRPRRALRPVRRATRRERFRRVARGSGDDQDHPHVRDGEGAARPSPRGRLSRPPGVAFAETLSRHEGLLVYRERAGVLRRVGRGRTHGRGRARAFHRPEPRTHAPRGSRRRARIRSPAMVATQRRRRSATLGSAVRRRQRHRFSPRAPRSVRPRGGTPRRGVSRPAGVVPRGRVAETANGWRSFAVRDTIRRHADLFQTCASRVAARAIDLGIAFPLGDERRERGSGPYPSPPPAPAASRRSRSAEAKMAKTPATTMITTTRPRDRRDGIAAGGMLAAHFAQNTSTLFSSALCETIAGVPFVPAALGLPGEPGPGTVG